jgi:hypothetical protein
LIALRPERLRHALVVGVLLICIAGTQALVDQDRARVNDEADLPFSLAAVVVRSFMGQVRGILADFLWLRVDEYQHRRRIVGGDLLRADDEALMPLVRLITWLNPHFIEAYALGGQWLAFHFDRPNEALSFYEEGIRNNPRSYPLVDGAAWVYWAFLHQNDKALVRAKDAAMIAEDDLQKFQALWLEAHILMSMGDRAGAIRVWHEIGRIPGYEETATVLMNKLMGPTGGTKR